MCCVLTQTLLKNCVFKSSAFDSQSLTLILCKLQTRKQEILRNSLVCVHSETVNFRIPMQKSFAAIRVVESYQTWGASSISPPRDKSASNFSLLSQKITLTSLCRTFSEKFTAAQLDSLFYDPKISHHVLKGPTLDPVSQLSPVCIFAIYFFKIHFNNIISTMTVAISPLPSVFG